MHQQPRPHSPAGSASSGRAPPAPPLPTTAVVAKAIGDNKPTASPRDSLDIFRHPGREHNWWPIAAVGLLLSAVALIQAVLASRIREKGIQIKSVFLAESNYPTAGNPAIGFLALSVAACFAVLFVLAKNDSHGGWVNGLRRATTMYSIVVFVAMIVCSFGERAVHRQLGRYEQCVENVGSDNVERRDECRCWDDVNDTSVEVYIASDADISCDSLLDYVGGIFVSYALMLTMLVLTAVGLWCRPSPSRPAILSIVLEANPQPYVVSPTKSQKYGGFRR